MRQTKKNPVICQSKFESVFAFERHQATKEEEEKNRLFQHFFPFKKTGFKLPVRWLVGLFSFQSIRFRFLSLSIQTRKFRGRPFMQKTFVRLDLAGFELKLKLIILHLIEFLYKNLKSYWISNNLGKFLFFFPPTMPSALPR